MCAFKQVRALRNDKEPTPEQPTLDLNEDERERKKVTLEDSPWPEEQYSNDDWICGMGKGPGKGGKGSGWKGIKGSFQGHRFHCGAQGHRISECRKKDADMQRKG